MLQQAPPVLPLLLTLACMLPWVVAHEKLERITYKHSYQLSAVVIQICE
jgi:hypothetical protein